MPLPGPTPAKSAALPFNARCRVNDLRAVPFVQLLLELHDAGDTGSLLLQGDKASGQEQLRVALRVVAGQPVAALSENYDASRDLRSILIELCALDTGRFEFVDEQDLVGTRGVGARRALDVFEIVMAAMRSEFGLGAIDRAMRHIGRNLVLLNPHASLARLGLNAHEREIVSAIGREPIDLAGLRGNGFSDELLLPVLSALWATRSLALIPAARRGVSGTVARARPSVPPRRPATSQRTALDTAAPPAGPSTISARPVMPAERYTPSGRPAPKIEEMIWENVERLSRRGHYKEALEAAHELLKVVDVRPEHQALLAWVIYQAGGAGPTAHPKVWRLLEHALRNDPLNEKALYYKARVLKCAGHADQAVAHLKRILLLNPKHIEALREVRLHEMRRVERQNSGLVRRMFGKAGKTGKKRAG